MKNLITSAAVVAGLTLSGVAAAQTSVVTNGNNDGPGSFRAALEINSRIINIAPSVTTIRITEPLEYTGTRRLGIFGLGTRQTIDGSALSSDDDIFAVTQGANFRIRNLDFIGSLDEVNDNPNNPDNGTGIFVNVPSSRTGTVRVQLENVTVTRVGSHGVHVSDCTVRDECFPEQGSPASILVDLENFTANRVGLGRQDGDGIRVDERGDGNIRFLAEDSTFINVGADGVELDEADDGDVSVVVDNTLFDSNGEYCNLVDDVDDTPCDNDGSPDLDDGFDIDEAGDGSIIVEITDSKLTNNLDEGLDFDEEGDGNIELTVSDSYALNNLDQGIRASEEGDGDVNVLFTNVTFGDNNEEDEATRLEEEDDGDITVTVVNSNVINSDDEAIRVEESNSGDGTLEIINSNFTEFDLDNVDQI